MRQPRDRRPYDVLAAATAEVSAWLAAPISIGLAIALGSCDSFDDLEAVGSRAPPPSRCGQCHVEIHEEWRKSGHADAFRSTVFLAHSDQGRIERCSSCHAPEPLGERPGRPLATRREARDEGVHCLSCHSVAEDHGVMGSRAVMAGPLGSESLVDPHPIEPQAERFRDSAFCGRCHEDTYREWLSSAPPTSASCQACHMPAVLRKVTQSTGLVSELLVSLEPALPLRAHEFSSAAAVEESVKVLGFDFLRPKAIASGNRVSIEVENLLPHSIPTGGFGGKRLAVAIEVDGVEVARHEISNRPGKALASGQSIRFEIRPGGPRPVEALLLGYTSDAAGGEVLWRRAAEWKMAREGNPGAGPSSSP